MKKLKFVIVLKSNNFEEELKTFEGREFIN